MATEKMSKWFPDPQISIAKGKLQEGGTTTLAGQEKHGPQRWVRMNDQWFTRVDDGLYHARYGDEVLIAHDSANRMIGYRNITTGAQSKPNLAAVRGVLALMVILSGALYLLGVWNLIWKSGWEWWVTISIIFLYSLYALLWTPMYAMKEYRRQKDAHTRLQVIE